MFLVSILVIQSSVFLYCFAENVDQDQTEQIFYLSAAENFIQLKLSCYQFKTSPVTKCAKIRNPERKILCASMFTKYACP